MKDFRTLRSKCALLAPVCLLVLGAAGNAAADTITLEWDASGGSVGYRVHVGTSSGAYTQHFNAGSATLYAFNTAVAGTRYCFAVSAYMLSSTSVEGPNSAEICGYSNAAPTLQNPGTRSSTVGQPTSLQLVGSDPQSQPLTYSASGLPSGLSVQSSTGYISGTGTTAGTYNVTARASDGTLTASQQFTWTMNSSTGGSGDTTRPVATITSPTSNSSYTASGSSMNLGGTATDNVGVTQITWSSDRGYNGTAAGTSNWNVSGIPLQNGTNVITVTAFDARGNSGVDTVTVTYSGTTSGGSTGGSTTGPPTIQITSPTSGESFATSSSPITVGGTTGGAVTRVMWSNDQTGGIGVASGTANWSISIPLASGTNYITVRSYDAAGNQSPGDFLVITRSGTGTTPPPTTTGDTTRPVATITSPTINSSYTASGSSTNLAGTATDNVGVSRVTWSSDRGGSGTAAGTASWSVSGIPLQSGTNVITVTAVDAAGNSGTDTVTVTYSGTSGGSTGGGSTGGGTTGPDTTRPTVAITSPTSGDTFATVSSSVTVAGTAADNVGVARVMWSNDRTGAIGEASGTTNWSISIPLGSGTNYITVRSYDAAGNQSPGDYLIVTR